MIRVHNTLTGTVDEFKPIKEGHVGMYHCGPTVYKHAHIGNLRAYVFADLLRRLFEYEGYSVKQVINITDVGHLVSDEDDGEDKMEIGAKSEGKSSREIAEFYTTAFQKDLSQLNINTLGTEFPKATEYIDEQVELIKRLEDKGFVYKTNDGVYFDTSKFPNYGKLGNINLAGLEEGTRIGINEDKKNPTDFALWKFSGDSSNREQQWPSPWGVGFPGWHVECSAMSMKLLGETFDIHTGGIEHIPVHHQNEIAQSEAATGKKFVDYWMHHEHMKIDGQKMSKSLGNTYLLKDVSERGFSPLAYRYLLLQSHYSTQANFTWEALTAAQNALEKLRRNMISLKTEAEGSGAINEVYKEEFVSALENDLNTPEALAVVWKLIKDETISAGDKFETLTDFDKVLGLKLYEGKPEVLVPDEVMRLVVERDAARIAKNWQKADELRDQVRVQGFEIKDTDKGQEISKL